MLDSKEFWDILRKHFAEVTTEEFLENVKKYCSEGPPDGLDDDYLPDSVESMAISDENVRTIP